MKKIKWFFIIGIASLVFACDSDDTNTTSNSDDNITELGFLLKSRDSLIVFISGESKKNWETKEFKVSSMSSFQDCRLDDMIEFNKDGTFLYDGGDILCGAEDEKKTVSGSWEILDDNKSIKFVTSDGDTYNGELTGTVDGKLTIKSSYMGMEVKGFYEEVQ